MSCGIANLLLACFFEYWLLYINCILRRKHTQESYPATVELYPGIVLRNRTQDWYQNQEPRMVLEPRTKKSTATKNKKGTGTKNQEPETVLEPRTKDGTRIKNKEWYQNQEPRMVPEPGTKNSAQCSRVYRESALA